MKRAANKKKKRELLKKGLIKASASKGNLNKGGQEGGHTILSRGGGFFGSNAYIQFP